MYVTALSDSTTVGLPETHRRTHGLQTYVRRPWLIVSVNLEYSFNVHA